MEEYLKKQYGVIEDKNYLTDVSEIEEYFKDNGRDYFDCGQGYYEEEVELIVHIGGKFYSVTIEAWITSAKQDYGDRLYWVEKIENVSYKEIEKPVRKTEYKYIKVSENDVDEVLELLKKEGIQSEIK